MKITDNDVKMIDGVAYAPVDLIFKKWFFDIAVADEVFIDYDEQTYENNVLYLHHVLMNNELFDYTSDEIKRDFHRLTSMRYETLCQLMNKSETLKRKEFKKHIDETPLKGKPNLRLVK